MEMSNKDTKSTVYVGGLDSEVTEEVLFSAFIPFGEITSVVIPKDFSSFDEHKGFGFVEFETVEDAKSAIDNMHLSELYGKVLKCNIARNTKIQDFSQNTKPIWEEDEWLQKYAHPEKLDDPIENKEVTK